MDDGCCGRWIVAGAAEVKPGVPETESRGPAAQTASLSLKKLSS